MSVSGSDSGVEIPMSPGSGDGENWDCLWGGLVTFMVFISERSLTNLPKVKTKDELLLMLNKIKLDGKNKSEDSMKLEEWQG